MRASRFTVLLPALLPTFLLALHAGATSALPRHAEALYQQERAACQAAPSPSGRAACLKDAGAARAELRRHSLDNGETPAQLRANALLRCRRVNDADRTACERMALGEGTRSGSVAEGAVVTQITTTTTAVLPAPAASR